MARSNSIVTKILAIAAARTLAPTTNAGYVGPNDVKKEDMPYFCVFDPQWSQSTEEEHLQQLDRHTCFGLLYGLPGTAVAVMQFLEDLRDALLADPTLTGDVEFYRQDAMTINEPTENEAVRGGIILVHEWWA